jgi:protocatechuate 3,4-dioxygenase beta subunit
MPRPSSPDPARLAPGPERAQPARAIAGYPRSLRRAPRLPLIARAWSRADAVALARVAEPPAPPFLDLSRVRPTAPRAMGQLMELRGLVVDEEGRPIRRALVEVWQANAAGKYVHHNDPSPVPVDPNFIGVGRVSTDAEGRFSIRTIKPGAYAVPYETEGGATDWWRPPHIHLSLFGPGFASRLVTQIYFPGEPLNRLDLLLNSIPDEAARERLIARFDPASSTPDGALGFGHELVLRGRRQTPFEEG